MQTKATNRTGRRYRLFVALALGLSCIIVLSSILAPHSLVSYASLLGADVFGFAACMTALPHTNRRLLKSWVLFGLACASAASVTAELAIRMHTHSHDALATVPVSVVAFQFFAVLGCLSLVALPVNPAARAQTLLDQVNVGVVSGLVAWLGCYKGFFALLTDRSTAIVAPTFLRVCGDSLLITLLVSICLTLRPRGRLSTPVLSYLGVGLGVFVLLDLFATRMHASPIALQEYLATGAALAALGVGLAASTPRVFVRRTPQVSMGLIYGQLIPGIASAAVLIVVLVELHIATNNGGIMEWLASSLVAVVLVRQVVSWKEEQRLVHLLEARVADRTEALGRREQQFRALVQKSTDVIVIVQANGTCTYVSPSLQYVFGHSADKLVQGSILDIVNSEDKTRVEALLEMARRRPKESLNAEWHVLHADGSIRLVEVLVRNLLDEPAVEGLVINLRDITERKELEDQLTHQSLHDHLTGLGNRSLLRVRTEHALGRWLFHNEPFSLLVVDITEFKTINDSLGHVIGDKALKVIAGRISEHTRRGDTVVRVDGDEFAVLIEGVAAADEEARNIAERISRAVQQPMRIEGRRIALRASTGIACVSERVSQADDIMRNADLALNAAKQHRNSGVVHFQESMHDAAIHRVELESDLRRALERDELQLFYQPTVSIETGMFEGVEALLRWPHPDKGFIPPLDFIPIAEESGLIVPIGKWVLEQACLQMAKWQIRYPSATPLKMNVNLSGRQFDQPDIVDVVKSVIDATGIAPGSLVLEVTESVLMENSVATRKKMDQLVAIGCQLAIDDFGTGYSSLSYLQQYPIGVLKIDRSFVNEIGNSEVDSEPALVKAIVDIARTMRLKTVAEGVETKEQLEELNRLGCDVAQGFYLAKPAPPIEVQRLIEQTHAIGAPLPDAAPTKVNDER